MSDDPHHTHDTIADEELPEGVILKEHSYDGIREYDQQLPRWWLITLYGAIAFAVGYWFLNHQANNDVNHRRIDREMAAIEAARMSSSAVDVTNDDVFWKMSENATIVAEGQKVFETNCVACHGADLHGGIGFNLVDATWVHGARPSEIYHTVFNGVKEKGMPTWGPILGEKRISQAVAYVLSKNDRSLVETAIKQEAAGAAQ